LADDSRSPPARHKLKEKEKDTKRNKRTMGEEGKNKDKEG